MRVFPAAFGLSQWMFSVIVDGTGSVPSLRHVLDTAP